MTIVNHWVDKKVVSYILASENPKLEIKQKCIIITEEERTVFTCKIGDFVSFAITEENTALTEREIDEGLRRLNDLQREIKR